MRTIKDVKFGMKGTKIELFLPIRRPEHIIKQFVNQEDDDELQTGLIKLIYKMNDKLYKLQASITSAVSNKKDGLYFSITFRDAVDDSTELMDYETMLLCLQKIKTIIGQFLELQELEE